MDERIQTINHEESSAKVPPTATREISVPATFSPLEFMVDIILTNETDRKYNVEHISLLALFNRLSKFLSTPPMKSKMTTGLDPKLDLMVTPLLNGSAVQTLVTDKGMEFKSVLFERLVEK